MEGGTYGDPTAHVAHHQVAHEPERGDLRRTYVHGVDGVRIQESREAPRLELWNTATISGRTRCSGRHVHESRDSTAADI
jgi:hypothetical protein